MRIILPIVLTAIVMSGLIALDIARPLGAHPWWSQKTLMIGAPMGVIAGALLGYLIGPARALFLALGLLVLAFATAKYGQTQFAASYAEDALAGKLWYFGWIGTGATLAATLFSAADTLRHLVRR